MSDFINNVLSELTDERQSGQSNRTWANLIIRTIAAGVGLLVLEFGSQDFPSTLIDPAVLLNRAVFGVFFTITAIELAKLVFRLVDRHRRIEQGKKLLESVVSGDNAMLTVNEIIKSDNLLKIDLGRDPSRERTFNTLVDSGAAIELRRDGQVRWYALHPSVIEFLQHGHATKTQEN